MNEPFLQLRGICKRFGAVEALRDVSLDMPRDELLVVLGPTGAGKTTLLRCIAGLETVERGSVLMEGQDVTLAPPAERDVALVFQNFSIYPNKTVRENLEFPLRAPGRKLSREQIDERVSWAAELLRIGHLLDRRSHRLSGGEMQRVAIGRAIVRHPRVFLMDEPLTNLDAKLRESLRVELVLLRRRLQTPMVFVTHDQAEALSMGDRIVVLDQGRVLQTGTPREVYRAPVSPTVARQLGQPAINLFEARRVDGAWVVAGGWRLAPAKPGKADRATVGVRPEDIDLEGGTVAATVRVVERLGPAVQLLCEIDGVSFHVLAPPGIVLEPGAMIHPRVRSNAAVVWPDEAGSSRPHQP
jgi:multiple sugar transport system ATP-binding protein